jgi:peroxiredoxin Q/BCP
MVKEGERAPDFSLPDDRGAVRRLAEFTGEKKVVLFFYPRAETPGCTKEATAFRDAASRLKKLGAIAVGVSPDPVQKLARFREKHGLNMTLLSDAGKEAARAYGVYKEKKMYGKTVMGVERTTFIIGKDGLVEKVFPKVKVAGHIDEVLGALAHR